MSVKSYVDATDEDLFGLLLDFKEYALIRINREGTILKWNKGAADLYGYCAEEANGQFFSFLYQVEERGDDSCRKLLHTAQGAGRYAKEGWMKRKDGTSFYANVILTPLYDEYHHLAGFAHVTKDVSERRKLALENEVLREDLEERVKQRTRELEVANKELEAFSYSVSHDLRTPLRAISGYSRILKEDYHAHLDAEGNRLIDTIMSNTKMMGDLIDDLLTFSKMARLETVLSSVDMNRLVQQCFDKLAPVGNGPAPSVASLPACKGDLGMLRQVWYNLLDNAIKYSSKKESPQILVGAQDDPKFHIYYVKDNGTGFDMKYAHKLFGVFQRLHRQDEFEGTGLGLALAQRIISKHGGKVWAEGVPGQGASFYFSIPK